ncbi:MAG: 50S ribosomal protein L11 methyltransferase [Alphaproteobacteria bacterium]|nr:50S ribosomal protein L11 methyltransferase [Alphaproteobacteria bacterium]
MNLNSGTCKIVKFYPCENIENNLAEFAEDFFEVVSIDYTEDNLEQLIGYMRQDFDESTLNAAAAANNINLPPYQIETVHRDNWLTENVIQFAPVEVADFLIYGVHEKNIDTNGKIGIKVYAATAFGSEHQTTKGCLQALSEIKQNNEAEKILDVGTGSGILAIAGAKLWPQAKIVAVDIDDEAVAVAAQNAADNDVSKQIDTAYSDGYTAELVQKNAPYDLIFANILARPLIEMAPQMADALKNGSHAIISGFIEEQTDWVLPAHEKYGLKLKKLYQLDNWCTAILEKTDAH